MAQLSMAARCIRSVISNQVFACPAGGGRCGLLVPGCWVGARRPFHLSLFLPAPRMVLPQDPSTSTASNKGPRAILRMNAALSTAATCHVEEGGGVV